MARVAREVVQKAGVDVDKLLEMLVRNASAELTTFVEVIRQNLESVDKVTALPRITPRLCA